MNAPDLFSRLHTPAGQGLTLRLKTLTPLYTGGIGQIGDQIHPSNLLGGLRHMSCLVARTLGDAGFESDVWGNAGRADQKASGKQVAIRWDTSRLKREVLPEKIELPARADGSKSRWWFNQAHTGELDLAITRRGISDAHWDMLRIALAIQLRHASFGSKDQFGLGVIGLSEDTRFAKPLDTTVNWPPVVPATPGRLNLMRYVFGRVILRTAPGSKPINLQQKVALTLGLAARATLRNALRAKPDAPDTEAQRLTTLRHRMLGHLNQFGSAVNVSAAYGRAESPEFRIVVALKSEDKDERAETFRAFREAIKANLDGMIDSTGYRVDSSAWEFGGAHTNDKASWLNKLAGV